jgi:uncharacterized membrane protein
MNWNVFILTPQFEFTFVVIYHNFSTAVLNFLQKTNNKQNKNQMRATESTLKMIWKLSVVAVIFIFSIVVSTLIFYKKLPNNPRGSKPIKHIREREREREREGWGV